MECGGEADFSSFLAVYLKPPQQKFPMEGTLILSHTPFSVAFAA
jgi:hypothetical protein